MMEIIFTLIAAVVIGIIVIFTVGIGGTILAFLWPVLKWLLLIIIGGAGVAAPVIYIWAVVAHFRDGEIIQGIVILLFGWIPAVLVMGAAYWGATAYFQAFLQ